MENGPLNITTSAEQPFAAPTGREWLQSMLRMGPVNVVFLKTDGTEREMKCTLQEVVIVPHVKTTERVKAESLETLAVWDIEKKAWRSFRLDSIKSVSFDL